MIFTAGVAKMPPLLDFLSELAVQLRLLIITTSAGVEISFMVATVSTVCIDQHRGSSLRGKIPPYLEGILWNFSRDGGDHTRVVVNVQDGREVYVGPMNKHSLRGIGDD